MHILLLLPLETRLLCRGVCRGWRALARSPELYHCVDLRSAARRTDALLAAAAIAASGQLRELDVSGVTHVSHFGLLRACRSNAGSLRAVCAAPQRTAEGFLLSWSVERVWEIVRGAGAQLQTLRVSARVQTEEEACRLLRRQAVELYALDVTVDELPELAPLIQQAQGLHKLHLRFGYDMPTLNALVDAAIAARIPAVHLSCPEMSPDVVPALTRLLASGVAELGLFGGSFYDVGPAAFDAFVAALHASRLVRLELLNCLRQEEKATAVLRALVGHATLRGLDVSNNGVDSLGTCLVELLDANAPALLSITARACGLRDAELAELPAALAARNRHLQHLDLRRNALQPPFVARLGAAAVAGDTLRLLKVDQNTAQDAEAAVAARALARGEAWSG